MAVFAERFVGTVGGGTLEFKALEIARRILDDGRTQSELREFPLGPAIGQCCGGQAMGLPAKLVDIHANAPPRSEYRRRCLDFHETPPIPRLGKGLITGRAALSIG